MTLQHFGIMLVACPSLERCAELSKLIETYGFDSLHSVDGAGSWDPFISTYEMIRVTNKIPVRLTVINPYHIHPVKIGLAAATLQALPCFW